MFRLLYVYILPSSVVIFRLLCSKLNKKYKNLKYEFKKKEFKKKT